MFCRSLTPLIGALTDYLKMHILFAKIIAGELIKETESKHKTSANNKI